MRRCCGIPSWSASSRNRLSTMFFPNINQHIYLFTSPVLLYLSYGIDLQNHYFRSVKIGIRSELIKTLLSGVSQGNPRSDARLVWYAREAGRVSSGSTKRINHSTSPGMETTLSMTPTRHLVILTKIIDIGRRQKAQTFRSWIFPQQARNRQQI